MPNFFYFDPSGQKFGPVNDAQLKILAAQGTISPQTQLETDTGHKGFAGQIPGLFAAPAPASPFAASTPQPQKATDNPASQSGHRKNQTPFIASILLAVAAAICLLLAVFFQSEMFKYEKKAQDSRDRLSQMYNKGEVGDAAFARNCCGILTVVLYAGRCYILFRYPRKKE